jgi:hypothetical protein
VALALDVVALGERELLAAEAARVQANACAAMSRLGPAAGVVV